MAFSLLVPSSCLSMALSTLARVGESRIPGSEGLPEGHPWCSTCTSIFRPHFTSAIATNSILIITGVPRPRLPHMHSTSSKLTFRLNRVAIGDCSHPRGGRTECAISGIETMRGGGKPWCGFRKNWGGKSCYHECMKFQRAQFEEDWLKGAHNR